MWNFIYRCPKTGLNVQGTVAIDDYKGQQYVLQTCLACNGIHLVDPLTGERPLTRAEVRKDQQAG